MGGEEGCGGALVVRPEGGVVLLELRNRLGRLVRRTQLQVRRMRRMRMRMMQRAKSRSMRAETIRRCRELLVAQGVRVDVLLGGVEGEAEGGVEEFRGRGECGA